MPDHLVINDDWSDLSRFRELPEIDLNKLYKYRLARIRQSLAKSGAGMCVLVSPISLRYALDYRTYGLFQAHIPQTYLFVPLDGPVVIYGAYEAPQMVDETRPGRPISFFDGGDQLPRAAKLFANDIVEYLAEIGTDNRCVGLEYVNPSLTKALMEKGLDVIDAVDISESARIIKSDEEIDCMKWAIAVAELGITKVRQAIRPGVREVQLWGLLNYTNLANNGDWHDGRMLASGPRTNPWYQEATMREVKAGDLVAFDTDMIGPFGYFADISRTFHCGPAPPTKRQKQLYQLACAEIAHNQALIKPGLSFADFQVQAYIPDEEFQQNAYVCSIHGVGMCDEYPKIPQAYREPCFYQGRFKEGMVVCVESYMGAVGETDGVKLEQQVLVTNTGCQLLSHDPLEECFLD